MCCLDQLAGTVSDPWIFIEKETIGLFNQHINLLLDILSDPGKYQLRLPWKPARYIIVRRDVD